MLELNQDIIDKARDLIDAPITYKKMMEYFGVPIQSGSAKVSQLSVLAHYMRIDKEKSPTRFIIREIYDEPKEFFSRNIKKTNKQDLIDFCEKRKIKILSKLPDMVKLTDKFEFQCEINPKHVFTSTFKDLRTKIGCPYCKYPMSRFEVMLHLGIEGSIHKKKIDGYEFDLYLPNEKIVVEFNGVFFHQNDEETGIMGIKQEIADEHGLRFIIIEENIKRELKKVEDNLYTVPSYISSNNALRKETNEFVSSFLPYKYKDGLWDKASEYMRQWKADITEQKKYKTDNLGLGKTINQYDSQGNLVNSFSSFKDIRDLIYSGHAFGYEWKFEEKE